MIQGDAKRHSASQETGIERAIGLCVVIDNNANNIDIALTSNAINPKLKIITRAGRLRRSHAHFWRRRSRDPGVRGRQTSQPPNPEVRSTNSLTACLV